MAGNRDATTNAYCDEASMSQEMATDIFVHGRRNDHRRYRRGLYRLNAETSAPISRAGISMFIVCHTAMTCRPLTYAKAYREKRR